MSRKSDNPVVLVVEDETDLADLYAEWLADEYAVRAAYDGEEALELLDDDVDAVLLDRRMPGLTGDDVLDGIRDRGLTCRVAMVTAVEPDVDVIELGFDDYLTKPVSEDDLHATVERLLTRMTYDERMQEHFALVSKKAVLETEMDHSELEANEEYAGLERRIRASADRLDTALADLSAGDLESVFRELETVHDASPSASPTDE